MHGKPGSRPILSFVWLLRLKRAICLQGLADAAGKDVKVSFTPHLMPMTRGMESDCYVKLAGGATADDLRAHLAVRRTWHAADGGCHTVIIFLHSDGSVLIRELLDRRGPGARAQGMGRIDWTGRDPLTFVAAS